jgi:ATP-binding cassette subfamily B protein
MTTQQLAIPSSLAVTAGVLPENWQNDVAKQLAPGENVLTSVEVDLDAKLRFKRGLVVVTNRRLLAKSPGEDGWRDWAYRPGLVLRHHDHAGVGHLELVDTEALLAGWRFTLGQNLGAIRVVDHFNEQVKSAVSGVPVAAPEQHTCPSCKAPLEADDAE